MPSHMNVQNSEEPTTDSLLSKIFLGSYEVCFKGAAWCKHLYMIHVINLDILNRNS